MKKETKKALIIGGLIILTLGGGALAFKIIQRKKDEDEALKKLDLEYVAPPTSGNGSGSGTGGTPPPTLSPKPQTTQKLIYTKRAGTESKPINVKFKPSDEDGWFTVDYIHQYENIGKDVRIGIATGSTKDNKGNTWYIIAPNQPYSRLGSTFKLGYIKASDVYLRTLTY